MRNRTTPATIMTPPPEPHILDIRKYPNRRYYDATRSRHLTLEVIRDLIKEGYDVRVTDNQTSTDITSKVLAQIILDLDAPKFDLFPAGLLTQLIRVNDQLLKGFYAKFFEQALQAFLDYQTLVESRLQQGGMMPAMFPPMHTWPGALLSPFGPQSPSPTEPKTAPSSEPASASGIAELQRQVEELKLQLRQAVRPPTRKPRRGTGGRRRKAS